MNFNDIVIAIIDEDGRLFTLEASNQDAKHIHAFLRFTESYKPDKFGILAFLKEREDNLGSITGFDLAKFVSSRGNVVFFHTDVHNRFLNVQKASLMIPTNISNSQKRVLSALMPDLIIMENYYGLVDYKKSRGKSAYRPIKIDEVYRIIGIEKERKEKMEGYNILEDNTLVAIDESENIFPLARSNKDTKHYDAYARFMTGGLSDILDNFSGNPQENGGYELAAHVSANGLVMIWSNNVNCPSSEIVSLPEVPTNEQCQALIQLFHPHPLGAEEYAQQRGIGYFLSTSKYRSKRSPKIITKILSDADESYGGFCKVLLNYVRKSLDLNNTGIVVESKEQIPAMVEPNHQNSRTV